MWGILAWNTHAEVQHVVAPRTKRTYGGDANIAQSVSRNEGYGEGRAKALSRGAVNKGHDCTWDFTQEETTALGVTKIVKKKIKTGEGS